MFLMASFHYSYVIAVSYNIFLSIPKHWIDTLIIIAIYYYTLSHTFRHY